MESLDAAIKDVDSLMVASALSLASMTPGPAGYAGAVAAIAYDTKRKQWHGVALSAASMIPVAGYVPGAFKVGLLVVQLDRRLKMLEERRPDIVSSPESHAALNDCLGKYYRKLPDTWMTRRLRKRLERIMNIDPANQTEAAGTSISTNTP